MKKKLLILAGLFMFFQLGFSLSCFFPHYSTDKGKIVYIGLGERKIAEEADTETFKELDHGEGFRSGVLCPTARNALTARSRLTGIACTSRAPCVRNQVAKSSS